MDLRTLQKQLVAHGTEQWEAWGGSGAGEGVSPGEGSLEGAHLAEVPVRARCKSNAE